MFNGKIHYKWGIFYSYVSLPEGSFPQKMGDFSSPSHSWCIKRTWVTQLKEH